MSFPLGRIKTETHSCSEIPWLPFGGLGREEPYVQIQDTMAMCDLCDLGKQLTSGLHVPTHTVASPSTDWSGGKEEVWSCHLSLPWLLPGPLFPHL